MLIVVAVPKRAVKKIEVKVERKVLLTQSNFFKQAVRPVNFALYDINESAQQRAETPQLLCVYVCVHVSRIWPMVWELRRRGGVSHYAQGEFGPVVQTGTRGSRASLSPNEGSKTKTPPIPPVSLAGAHFTVSACSFWQAAAILALPRAKSHHRTLSAQLKYR